MKSYEEINSIMKTIPAQWRTNWCGGENGPCACLGCVQIGNRVIMYEKTCGKAFYGDPEYIDERKIPTDIYNQYKITKKDYLSWMRQSKDLT